MEWLHSFAQILWIKINCAELLSNFVHINVFSVYFEQEVRITLHLNFGQPFVNFWQLFEIQIRQFGIFVWEKIGCHRIFPSLKTDTLIHFTYVLSDFLCFNFNDFCYFINNCKQYLTINKLSHNNVRNQKSFIAQSVSVLGFYKVIALCVFIKNTFIKCFKIYWKLLIYFVYVYAFCFS